MCVCLHLCCSTGIFRRHNASHSFTSGMMAAQSQGVYTEAVVCTDGCGSRRVRRRMKNPNGGPHFPADIFFFPGVSCFALMWFQKSAPSEVTALDYSFYDGTRKLLHLDFRSPSHMRAYCSYMQPDNIIQAGLCLNTQTSSCSNENHKFLF